MPSILNHHSNNSTKLLLLGESGKGKTGALISLVLAGYKLRILDYDNGADIIRNYLTKPSSPYYAAAQKLPNLEDCVRIQTITEVMKTIQGRAVPAKATVWTRSMSQLDHWKYTDPITGEVEDLGKPRDWPSDHILVQDSMTPWAQGALDFIQAMNGRLGVDMMVATKGFDPRREIGQAQTQIANALRLLYDDTFKPNVIVIAHIKRVWQDDAQITTAGAENMTFTGRQGYPNAIGKAISPLIPRFFNNMLQCITVGSGKSEKHKIVSVSWDGVSAKSTAPSEVAAEYDISDGLAKFFAAVR